MNYDNESYTLLHYFGIKLGYLQQILFDYKLGKNNSDYEDLLELTKNSLPKKLQSIFEEKVEENKFIVQGLSEGKELYKLLITDPVTGDTCFGKLGNIVNMGKPIKDDKYGPFIKKKYIKLLTK